MDIHPEFFDTALVSLSVATIALSFLGAAVALGAFIVRCAIDILHKFKKT